MEALPSSGTTYNLSIKRFVGPLNYARRDMIAKNILIEIIVKLLSGQKFSHLYK